MPEILTPRVVEITARPDGDGYLVEPVWDNVDRPRTGGWVVTSTSLAGRLEAALLAGVVFESAEVATDVNGHSYVATRSKVMGRYMNADLRRLGY